MKYADSCCKHIESYHPHQYKFIGPCVVTREEYSVTVEGQELHRYRCGEYIQDAFPNLSRADREFLLTGISPKGWEILFKEEK